MPYRTLLLIDAKTGAIDRDLPDPDCYVTSAVADGSGGWYIGGCFTYIGKVPREKLAHLRSDGSLDRAFAPSLPPGHEVDTVLRHGRVVYTSGQFGVATFDARSGKRLWRVSIEGDHVSGLAFGNGVLYVSGTFARIGDANRDGIAALDPASGKPTEWQVQLSGSSPGGGGVGCVTVADGLVFIGGDFTRVYGIKRELGLAAVNPRDGRPTTWAPSDANLPLADRLKSANEILVSHGQVLVGGEGGWEGFSVFDARTARPLPWRQRLNGNLTTFAVSGNTVYLGNGNAYDSFSIEGGKPVNNLAAVVLPAGKFTNWRPYLRQYVDVEALAVSDRKVLVGGMFVPRPKP